MVEFGSRLDKERDWEKGILTDTSIKALQLAQTRVEGLGEEGKKKVAINQHGEMAMLADIRAEEVIINHFRQQNLSLRIFSEEHGITLIGQGEVAYTAFLDGVDGSKAMESGRRYGTLLSVFKGENPSYADYIVAGVVDYRQDQLLIAVNNAGAYLIDQGGRLKRTNTSNWKALDMETRIVVDGAFEINRAIAEGALSDFRNLFVGHLEQQWGSSSMYYKDLATGRADVIVECTRKGNLEITAGYAMAQEAGGAVVDLNGALLGEQKILEFHQKDMWPIISAASLDLAGEIAGYIRERVNV